jgi:hypothetical protein
VIEPGPERAVLGESRPSGCATPRDERRARFGLGQVHRRRPTRPRAQRGCLRPFEDQSLLSVGVYLEMRPVSRWQTRMARYFADV